VVLGEKLGATPVGNPYWTLKVGDTILAGEGSAPDSTYSILDVSDPANPRFKGYVKTGLLPKPSLQEDYFTRGNILFFVGTHGPTYPPLNPGLYSFAYENGAFVLLDTLQLPVGNPHGYYRYNSASFPTQSEDSTLVVTASGSTSFTTWYTTRQAFVIGAESGGRLTLQAEFNVDDAQFIKVYRKKAYFGTSYNMGGGYNRKLFHIADFRSEAKVFVETMPWMDAPDIPKLAQGRLLHDSLMKAAHQVYLDTLGKLAYVITDKELGVYRYVPSPIAIRASRSRASIGNGAWEILETGGIAVKWLRPAGQWTRATFQAVDVHGRRAGNLRPFRKDGILWDTRGLPTGTYILTADIDGRKSARKYVHAAK
jgi:hypothetical protein